MNRFNIYKVRVKVLLMAALLFVGCTADDDTAVQQEDTLQLAAYTRSYTDVTTRAVPGYSAFKPEGVTSIGIYMTPADEGDPALEYFSYNGFKWQSNIGVKARQYYIYGFMPGDVINKSNCSITPLSADYANGAVLTLDGLKPISKTDVCVVVGVGGTTEPSTDNNNAQLGSFLYDGTGKGKGQHYVNLLMDHIYSCLQFRMQIEDSYSAIRTIKLKRMELQTAKISATKATITLTANTTNPLSIAWDTPTASTGMSITIFESEDGKEPELPSVADAAPLLLSGNVIPGCTDDLSLVCTYDVYDRKGNLMRKDCKATNTLPKFLGISGLKAGERQPIELTVAPTYLYVLSDPDLNNPDITFN